MSLDRAAPQGFTLVELLVVLAVIGAAAVLVVPNLMTGRASADLAAAERELRAALRGARSFALAANRPIRVTIDENGRGYAVDGERRAFRATAELRAQLLAFGASRPATLTFFPSGGASGGRIVLRTGATMRTLELDPGTGTVSRAR